MASDYLAAFPIPADVLPPRLRGLLEPVGLSPSQFVEAASIQETDPHGNRAEHVHLMMAVVPSDHEFPIQLLSKANISGIKLFFDAGVAQI
jgi:hypothetical protein